MKKPLLIGSMVRALGMMTACKSSYMVGHTPQLSLTASDFDIVGNCDGSVGVSYIVEKDGTITNVKVEQENNCGGGEAVAEVIRKMGKLRPATDKYGKPVRTRFTLPVRFEHEGAADDK